MGPPAHVDRRVAAERAVQAARRATAERAIALNPLLTVQWIDAEHEMAFTHPHNVAKAVTELEPKS
jgi:hypothetical protein